MIAYYEDDFLELLRDKFGSEMVQYNIDFKIIKLNDQDVLILIVSTNNKRRINSSVRDTDIVFNETQDENGNDVCEIILLNEKNLNTFFSKIKKTIFDICLVK